MVDLGEEAGVPHDRVVDDGARDGAGRHLDAGHVEFRAVSFPLRRRPAAERGGQGLPQLVVTRAPIAGAREAAIACEVEADRFSKGRIALRL
jgi:hypothetical protein